MTDRQAGPDEGKRRAFFAELIRLQDKGTSITASQSQVAKQFKVTVADIRAAEEEGIANDWPPLGD